MTKRHRIKLNIKTEKQLNSLVCCKICNKLVKYRYAYFYTDENNISITNNSKPICANCK